MSAAVEVNLVNGKGVMLIDAEDEALVRQYRWYRHESRGKVYARTGHSRNGTLVRAHRFIMGAPAGVQVDHKNGDGLDNRRANLRLATVAQNQHNQHPQAGGSSPYKGVSLYKRSGKWRARIRVNGHLRSLGMFTDELAAARAYDAAAAEAFGEWAHLNFPPVG